MKFWLFNQKLETRADSSYTDALVAAITANAGGQSTALASATGALEACSGMISRAFMTAEVKSDPIVVEALTPDVLGMIGRALIRKGQIVQYIDTSSGSLRLLPCESHDVAGYPDPDTWRYTCTIGGPERTLTYEPRTVERVLCIFVTRKTRKPHGAESGRYSRRNSRADCPRKPSPVLQTSQVCRAVGS